VKPSAYIRRSV